MRSSIDAVQVKVFQFKRFRLSIGLQPVSCRCDSGQRIVAEADARCHVRVRRQVPLIPDLCHQQPVALRLIIGRCNFVAVGAAGNPPRFLLQPVVFVTGGTEGEIKRLLLPAFLPCRNDPAQIAKPPLIHNLTPDCMECQISLKHAVFFHMVHSIWCMAPAAFF